MSIQKKSFNFRFSEETQRMMYFLAGRLDLTNTSVVEHAIRFYYQSYHEQQCGNGILPFTKYNPL